MQNVQLAVRDYLTETLIMICERLRQADEFAYAHDHRLQAELAEEAAEQFRMHSEEDALKMIEFINDNADEFQKLCNVACLRRQNSCDDQVLRDAVVEGIAIIEEELNG